VTSHYSINSKYIPIMLNVAMNSNLNKIRCLLYLLIYILIFGKTIRKYLLSERFYNYVTCIYDCYLCVFEKKKIYKRPTIRYILEMRQKYSIIDVIFKRIVLREQFNWCNVLTLTLYLFWINSLIDVLSLYWLSIRFESAVVIEVNSHRVTSHYALNSK
jgi:hypothetical protein